MSRQPVSRRRPASPGMVLLALCALTLVFLYRSGLIQRWWDQASQARSAALSDPAAGAGAVRVFFTTPELVYPDVSERRPLAPLLQAVLADLDAAHASLDLASFDFDIVELTDALVRAQRRGVAVRVIVDSENLDTPEVSQQTGRLQAAGIPVRFDRREPFMHDKFVVVDGAIAWLGSTNLTTNDIFRNNNNMLRLASREVAADYTHEFEQMFAGRYGTAKRSVTPYSQVRIGGAPVAVYFSPQDGVAQHVLRALADARTSIHFMTFSYTSEPIAQAMIAQVRAGLTVRGVFEKQNAAGTGARFAMLKAGGVDVLEDGNCYIMHHKVIVIDGRIVITGSYNFTGSAERDNDENLVIIEDQALARAYLDEFKRIYAQAQSPMRCR